MSCCLKQDSVQQTAGGERVASSGASTQLICFSRRDIGAWREAITDQYPIKGKLDCGNERSEGPKETEGQLDSLGERKGRGDNRPTGGPDLSYRRC